MNNIKKLIRDPWLWVTIILIIVIILVLTLELDISLSASEKTTATTPIANQKELEQQVDKLFETPSQYFTEYAKQVGLDIQQFNTCYATRNTTTIQEDVDDATALGITEVPSMIINGNILQGKQGIDDIEDALNNPTEEANITQREHRPILGKKDAETTITLFTDYQCAFCRSFHEETYPKLKEQYIDTGKVNIEIRHLIEPSHQYAPAASIAALCAEQQGLFEEYYNLLLQQQEEWST